MTTATPSLYPLISQNVLGKWRDRSVQRYNLGSHYHEVGKIKQIHRASVVAPVTKTLLLCSLFSVLHDLMFVCTCSEMN